MRYHCRECNHKIAIKVLHCPNCLSDKIVDSVAVARGKKGGLQRSINRGYRQLSGTKSVAK
jgi:hypothetical protein